MIRNVSLINQVPLYLGGVEEIKQIVNAENPEFQTTADESENIKNNQFVNTLTIDGANRWEKILKIPTNINDVLEDRRFRVSARLKRSFPYTEIALKNDLSSLTNGDYTLFLDSVNSILKIRISVNSKSNFNEILNLLNAVCPANLIIDLWYKYDILTKCGDMLCGQYHITGTIGEIISSGMSLSNLTTRAAYAIEACGTFPNIGTIGVIFNQPMGMDDNSTSGLSNENPCGTLPIPGTVGLIIDDPIGTSFVCDRAQIEYDICNRLIASGTIGLTINNPLGASCIESSAVNQQGVCGALIAAGSVGLAAVMGAMALSTIRTFSPVNYMLCGELICGA